MLMGCGEDTLGTSVRKGFSNMTSAGNVRIGEHFQSAGRTAFGHASGEVFEVHDVRVEGCIVPHAQLVNLTNPTDRKLISVDALRDTKLYLPVKIRNVEPDE
jgi:hypothetical protein